MPLPKLYSSLASWFHLLTAPADYGYEAVWFRELLTDACDGTPRTMLELGSGGGNSASHLKAHFEMTLVDLSPEMLELSRTINPECAHIAGDMRTVRLGRQFDAVFVHDAVMYMTTEDDLRAATETAFTHTRPGGATLFVPDCVGETFAPRTKHGGHDGPDGRALRYLEWTYDPDPTDASYVVEFAILLRDAHSSVRVEHDRHEFGLFSRLDWLRLLGEAGFQTKSVTSDDPDLAGEVFVAARPAGQLSS
jgi:SAM-dependent methyltransferase